MLWNSNEKYTSIDNENHTIKALMEKEIPSAIAVFLRQFRGFVLCQPPAGDQTYLG
jgi:hypothetical protein